MQHPAPRLTVHVMTFNEVETLPSTCAEILAVCSGLGVPYEVVIIDDGSTDGSAERADALAVANAQVRVVHHPENLGLGGVYRTGFREARGELMTFFPADGQFPASIIADFLPRASHVDLVLGYLPQRNDALAGRFFSVVQRLLYAAMFGSMPRFQGILMFRRELLDRIPLVSSGRSWVVLMEFILRAVRSGAAHESVPTAVRARAHGTSKVNNWRTIRATLAQMLVLRRDMKRAAGTGPAATRRA
jgi:glycosyltransferase involved in cell wall biosynthesis